MEISPGPPSSDVAATPRTSIRRRLCDICSRINIEALSSPEGFPHIYKSTRSSCYLCYQIFYYRPYRWQMDGRPIRTKLSQEQSKIGLVSWVLTFEGEEQRISTEIDVVTRENWRFISCHRRWSVDFRQVIQLRLIMVYLH
jgi:hypothetical protein